MEKGKMYCPVCNEVVDMFDICDICDWQNSGDKEKDDGSKGSNSIYLWEAKVNWQNKVKN